jgi:hypothetical protein
MTVVARPGGINTPQSPMIIYGRHNATLAKTERIRRFLAGYCNGTVQIIRAQVQKQSPK